MGADRDILTERFGLDPLQHGLSMERIPLHQGHKPCNLFGEMPPVGVPFVEVSALLGGDVMLSFGARLPDHHVLREGGCRARSGVIREFAAALIRAADLSEARAGKPSPGADWAA